MANHFRCLRPFARIAAPKPGRCLLALTLLGLCQMAGAQSPATKAAKTASTQAAPAPAGKKFALAELRKKLHTNIFGSADKTPAPEPPELLFAKVKYPAPNGLQVAYVSPQRSGDERQPAVIWLHGGFDTGIDADFWKKSPRSNDQTAQAFRNAGLLMMLPSLRGANENPGRAECFLGEVDDVIAALDYLAKRPDVDPKRIYLAGHSTGGTLALLVAASTDRFRAVIAFGPVADVRQYGKSGCMPDNPPDEEVVVRSPMLFMDQIVTPTFVIEGEKGNADVFPFLQERIKGSTVRFVLVPGASHFSVLAPGTEVVAKAIWLDKGPTSNLDITARQIQDAR
jgi:dipeptidyl aminopeptidase/acylaminoacyl peptidase